MYNLTILDVNLIGMGDWVHTIEPSATAFIILMIWAVSILSMKDRFSFPPTMVFASFGATFFSLLAMGVGWLNPLWFIFFLLWLAGGMVYLLYWQGHP